MTMPPTHLESPLPHPRVPIGPALNLRAMASPLAVCNQAGEIVETSPSARALLARRGVAVADEGAPQSALPPALWRALLATPTGVACEWVGADEASQPCVSATRYELGAGHSLVSLREARAHGAAASQGPYQHHREGMRRLASSVAHDVRTALTSLAANTAVLAQAAGVLDEHAEVLADIRAASQRLERTIEELLGFARVGPPVTRDVPLRAVCNAVAARLHASLRAQRLALAVEVREEAAWVRANALALEQILVDLVAYAAAAAAHPGPLELRAERHGARVHVHVHVQVRVDTDAPGAPAAPDLAIAREAARELGGELRFDVSARGAAVVLELPVGAAGA